MVIKDQYRDVKCVFIIEICITAKMFQRYIGGIKKKYMLQLIFLTGTFT